ncbi:[NiFe] hydrogenase metallocenter assembly protein HypD [Klebsiella michiganensis]|uniref:[NiFe] hydrogenase metallocenter assembly protein HypD n=1 Tax=Klebsiella michiganensis TaxID=1134687 RepID=A0A7H4MTB2_9ENTR|nr:[NiFe] hydrogenase metallocenter assembly protein HypD [Klebsiella michiganensis]
MVIGTDAYGFIASDYHRPLVVAGFEPLDLLQGAVMLVEQTIARHSDVENQYRRVVPDAGNPLAQSAIAEVFCLSGDSEWRGLGVINDSGVHLNGRVSAFRRRSAFPPGAAAGQRRPARPLRRGADRPLQTAPVPAIRQYLQTRRARSAR